MSLGNCIPGMVKRGEIDPQRGARMKALFEELEAHYRASMGPDAAAAEASEATLKQLRAEARLKKRQTLLQINRQREVMRDLERFRGDSPYAAVSALLDDDDRAPYRGGNVTTAARRIEYQVHARIGEVIKRHSRDLAGRTRDPEAMDNIIRELHDQSTGDAYAKAAATAIGEGAYEPLRLRFNAAGGNIRKLAGYGVTHKHDALRVRSAGRDRWIDDVLPLLDRGKMIDDRTGVPFTEPKLREVLTDVWDTIRTNGLTGDASAAFRGGGKLASRRAEHRFLHFRDGDAWLEYNRLYGSDTDGFTAIMGHVSSMSRDIAVMERLGPNPDATMRYVLDHVDRQEAQGGKARPASIMGTSAGRAKTEALWRFVKGETSVPVVPETALGQLAVDGIHGLRNWNVASMLGSATLSSITDVVSGVTARRYYGLPETQALAHLLKTLVPRTKADRALALQLGAGLEHEARTMATTARLFGETRGSGWTQVMADGVLRASGMNMWTAKQQDSFVVDMFRYLGSQRGRTWDDLPDGLRTALDHAGLDQFDWTAIRQSTPIAANGGEYIDVSAIGDRRAADRLADFVLRGRSGAVIEPSPTSQVKVSFGTRAGDWPGEVIRNSFQFKTFVAALTIKQFRMMSAANPRLRASYAAQFLIGMTVMGAAVIQLREIAKGKDPRPMNKVEFWRNAALQSGGIGIAGDLLGVFSEDRIDGVGQFLGGPAASFAVDAWRAGQTALPKYKDGELVREGNPGKAGLRLAKRHLPGTNLWYARAAFERLVIDALDERLNAEVDDDRGDQIRRAEKQGQAFWWSPGDAAPARAPEWMNAIDGEVPAD